MSNIRKVFTKREYDLLEELRKKGGSGTVEDATNNNKGVIIPGIGLNINNQTPGVIDVALGEGFNDQGTQGDISLAKATTEKLGGIIVGDGLQVNENGVLSTSGGSNMITIPIEIDSAGNTFTCTNEQSAIAAIKQYLNGTANIRFVEGTSEGTIMAIYTPIKVQAVGTGTKMYGIAIYDIEKAYTCSLTEDE